MAWRGMELYISDFGFRIADLRKHKADGIEHRKELRICPSDFHPSGGFPDSECGFENEEFSILNLPDYDLCSGQFFY